MTTTLKFLSLSKPATMLVVVWVLALGPARAVAQTLLVVSETTGNVLRYNAQTGAFIDEFVSIGSGGLSAPGTLMFIPEPSTLTLAALALLSLVVCHIMRGYRSHDLS